MKTAIELITDERKRQIDVMGYTPEHDDEHKEGELANAACSYAMTLDMVVAIDQDWGNDQWLKFWPFELELLNKHPDNDQYGRIRDLIKAGALIVAEIERFQRLEAKPDKIRIIQVCETDCDHRLHKVQVNSHSYIFCCKKGFEKSLKEFAKTQGGTKMTKTEQFQAKVAAIPDAELAEKCDKALSKLCETGGKSFRMCIPPMVEDTDILFAELIKRFESRDKWISVKERWPEPFQSVAFVIDHPGSPRHGMVYGGIFTGGNPNYDKPVNEFSTPGFGTVASHWMPLREPPKEDEK